MDLASEQTEKHISRLGQRLLQELPRLFPSQLGFNAPSPSRDPAPPLPEKYARTSVAIAAPSSGYFRDVDGDRLMAVAAEYDLVIHIGQRPGRFILRDAPLAHAHPASRATHEARIQLQTAFQIRPDRLEPCDSESIIEQLVQMACRALSPTLNDPFLAIACIDWLGAGLRALTGQALPSPFRNDADGVLRVVARSTSLSEVAERSFSEIRYFAAASPSVAIRLFEQAAELARFARRSEDRRWLGRHIHALQESVHQHLVGRADRDRVNQAWKAALEAVGLDQRDRPPEEHL